MRTCPLIQVDVFSDSPLRGNALSVVRDDSGALSTREMQLFARETNLSETAFIGACVGGTWPVRIFTPRCELPFAGHPLLGCVHALLAWRPDLCSNDGDVVLQTSSGRHRIRVETATARRFLHLTIPAFSARIGPTTHEIAAALSVPVDSIVGVPQTVDVGIPWHIAEINSLEVLSKVRPDGDALISLERKYGASLTIFTMAAADPSCLIRTRSFAPSEGIPEDPVCGSGNACVAAYLLTAKRVSAPLEYRAEQGIEIARPGTIIVGIEQHDAGPTIRIGGECVTVIVGELHLANPPPS